MLTIHSIGHSVRSSEDFMALLTHHGIRQLADIRSIPRSRRHPQFNEHTLARTVSDADIAYRHFEDLGGRRKPRPDSPNHAFRHRGWQAYADHMGTESFVQALQQLMNWAEQAPTAMMCAEARPNECHRRLTADALTLRGARVLHIVALAAPMPHQLHENAMMAGNILIYPAAQTALF